LAHVAEAIFIKIYGDYSKPSKTLDNNPGSSLRT